MENTDRRRWLTLLGAAPVLAGVGALIARERSDAHPSFQPATGALAAREALRKQRFPDVPVVTQDGKTFLFYSDLVKDKKVILSFFNSQVMPHSKTLLENLAKLQKFYKNSIGTEFMMYTITTNPKRDTPAVLKAWATQHGAGRGWQFLTGKPADIEKLNSMVGPTSPFAEDHTPEFPISSLRLGVEPEMRWTHCQSLGPPQDLAHSIELDLAPGKDRGSPVQFNCRRLVDALG